MTGSVTTNINGERQNPDAHVIQTLVSLVANVPHHTDSTMSEPSPESDACQQPTSQTGPTIAYAIRGHSSPLNHWDDPRYFISAFPTLFPTGAGGHLNQRILPVSLASFSSWALSHHSRRHVYLSQPTYLVLITVDSPVTGHLCICYTTSYNFEILRQEMAYLQNDLNGNR